MRPHRYGYRNPTSSNPTARIVLHDGQRLHVYQARSGVLVVSPHPESEDFSTTLHYLVWSYRSWTRKLRKRLREGDPA